MFLSINRGTFSSLVNIFDHPEGQALVEFSKADIDYKYYMQTLDFKNDGQEFGAALLRRAEVFRVAPAVVCLNPEKRRLIEGISACQSRLIAILRKSRQLETVHDYRVVLEDLYTVFARLLVKILQYHPLLT